MTDTPTRPKPRTYTRADLLPIMEGRSPVPNLEELPLAEGLGLLAMYAWADGGHGKALVDPFGPRYGEWARYFLDRGQSGGLTGSGIVIWASTTHDPEYKVTGRIARFAVCLHEFVSGPGANPQRGWNPGYCGKCGTDLSVDSGD